MITLEQFAKLPRAIKKQRWREYQKNLLASLSFIAEGNLQSFQPLQPYGVAIRFRDIDELKRHCEDVKRKCR